MGSNGSRRVCSWLTCWKTCNNDIVAVHTTKCVQVVVVWAVRVALVLLVQQLGCRGELIGQSADPSDRVVLEGEPSLHFGK